MRHLLFVMTALAVSTAAPCFAHTSPGIDRSTFDSYVAHEGQANGTNTVEAARAERLKRDAELAPHGQFMLRGVTFQVNRAGGELSAQARIMAKLNTAICAREMDLLRDAMDDADFEAPSSFLTGLLTACVANKIRADTQNESILSGITVTALDMH